VIPAITGPPGQRPDTSNPAIGAGQRHETKQWRTPSAREKIATLRRELLGQLLIVNEQHPRRVPDE
jgi:hypothetical protein